MHSLIQALVRYTNIKFILISPEELRLPGYIRKDVLEKQNIPYEEVERLEEAGEVKKTDNLQELYITKFIMLHMLSMDTEQEVENLLLTVNICLLNQ